MQTSDDYGGDEGTPTPAEKPRIAAISGQRRRLSDAGKTWAERIVVAALLIICGFAFASGALR